jgi:hypothetical protein
MIMEEYEREKELEAAARIPEANLCSHLRSPGLTPHIQWMNGFPIRPKDRRKSSD